MKKLFVSAGLVAAGTLGLQAAYAPGLGPMQTTKLWSISATLRGFYDDNYAMVNNQVRGSYGFEVNPQIQFSMPLQQTELGLRYIYGLYYYQEREELGQNPIDQSHEFDLWMDHAFTERWQMTVEDTFNVAQDPQLLTPGPSPPPVPYRVEGNNIHNFATVTLNTDWTRLFSTVVTYNNTWYDYEQSGGNFLNPSLAGLLNDIDQKISLDLQWQFGPETVVLFGGSAEQVNYLGNEQIALNPLFFSGKGPLFYTSSDRDSRSYYGYAGIQHTLLPNLFASVQAGVQYTEAYKDPVNPSPSIGPYANVSLVYTYVPGSYVQLGFTQARNITDVIAVNNTPGTSGYGTLTFDQESSVIYATINHSITSKLIASAVGNWQYSTYEGGAFANQSDEMWSVTLDLSYFFTQHFSADVGYVYNHLMSNIYQRGFSENRIYLGVTASY